MKIPKRKFFQVLGTGLGYLLLSGIFIPYSRVLGLEPYRPLSPEPVAKKKSKHPKDELCGFQPSPGKRPLFSKQIICRDYIAREVIQDRASITRHNLIDEQDCSKCNYEDVCKASGTRFAFEKRKLTRTLYPALFGRDLQYDFVNNGG